MSARRATIAQPLVPGPRAIWFQAGTVQFWYRDYAGALDNLSRVAEAVNRVDLNTGVLAWMRVGQIYDLSHRRAPAVAAYQKAIAVAPQAEAARESQRYLSTPYRGEKS